VKNIPGRDEYSLEADKWTD